MNLENFTILQCSEESIKKFDLPVKDKRELISLINDSIYRKCAKTLKEKFDLLDLRDKVLKLIRFEINLSNASINTSSNNTNANNVNEVAPSELLIGSCLDMCPEKERYSRGFFT